MKQQLLDNNYIIIEDLISPEASQQLYEQLKKDIKDYPQMFDMGDMQAPKSPSIYNYRFFVELLIGLLGRISQESDEFLLPTYSYARVYSNGAELVKHTDRPACEVSATLHLGGDKDWPIFFTKPDGTVVSYELKPGQGVIYLGEKSEHWREKFEGTEYGQVFLHYVRARGDNWMYAFDHIRG